MKATPEQQAQYDAVVTAARGIIYGDQGTQMVLQKLASGRDDMGESIGHTAAMILASVKGGIEKKGRTIPPEILFNADKEIVQDLVDIAEASRMIEGGEKKQVANAAFLNSAKAFGKHQETPQQPEPPQAQPGQPPQGQPQQPQPQPGIVAGAMGAQ